MHPILVTGGARMPYRGAGHPMPPRTRAVRCGTLPPRDDTTRELGQALVRARERRSSSRRIFAAHAPHLPAGLLRSSLTHPRDGLAPVLVARPPSGAPGPQISRRLLDRRSLAMRAPLRFRAARGL